MDDWKIKLSYKSYLGQLKFCATSIKKFISHENKICHQTHPCHASLTSHCSKFTNVKTFLTLKLSQHLKSGSTFCSSVPVVALIDGQCCRLGNQSCGAAAPKDQPLISQSKPLIAFWNDLWEWLSDEQQRLQLGSNSTPGRATRGSEPAVIVHLNLST